MLAPRKDAQSKRPRRAKHNRSSRTKTSRKNRKKDKKPLSVDQVRSKVETLVESEELLLPKLFDDAAIEAILNKDCTTDIDRRSRVYTIPITLTLFVQQALSKERGCKEVVTLFNKYRKEQQLKEVSTNTSSYCEARMRIPVQLIKILTKRTCDMTRNSMPKEAQWFGRRVLLVDGLVVSAPDTPENQKVYPQPSSQKAGLGFPQIRLCFAFCLGTRVIAEARYGPVEGKKTGEATLFRSMFDDFEEGDIIVADSNFECFRDFATLVARGVDIICDKNGSRTSPFKGKVTGVIEDTLMDLPRPGYDSSRFTREEWEELPETLTVRMIRFKVRGRKKEITIVTTLLDTEAYPAQEIAKLYKLRWECELDIRSIKSLMGMTWLSCHTPEMLERELLVYVLAYNLICLSMCDAAKVSGYKPRDLSFKNAQNSWLQLGQDGHSLTDYAWLLWSIAHAPSRKRPGRNEPREIKRRNSKYKNLNQPRALEKPALAA